MGNVQRHQLLAVLLVVFLFSVLSTGKHMWDMYVFSIEYRECYMGVNTHVDMEFLDIEFQMSNSDFLRVWCTHSWDTKLHMRSEIPNP